MENLLNLSVIIIIYLLCNTPITCMCERYYNINKKKIKKFILEKCYSLLLFELSIDISSEIFVHIGIINCSKVQTYSRIRIQFTWTSPSIIPLIYLEFVQSTCKHKFPLRAFYLWDIELWRKSWRKKLLYSI